MDKDTSKSTFLQLFKPILNKNFLEKIKTLGVDKYTQKLIIEKYLKIMIYAQLEQH